MLALLGSGWMNLLTMYDGYISKNNLIIHTKNLLCCFVWVEQPSAKLYE